MNPRFMWVLFFLAACEPKPCINPDYQVAPAVPTEELRAEWESRFGPLPEPCDEPLYFEAVADPDPICGVREVAGCFIDNGCPHVVIGSGFITFKELAAHETAHWFLRCSGRDRTGDGMHTLPDVWGTDGFVQHW